MARAIYFQALTDYFRVRRLIPWLFLALFCAGVAILWRAFSPASAAADRYSVVSYMLVLRIVGFSAVFFATANVPAEIEQRTIAYVLTRPIPRWLLLLARYLAAATVVIAMGFVSAFAVSAAAFGGHALSNPLLARDLLAIVLAGFAYTGVFTLLSVMTPGRTMIIGLIYLVGWEILVPNMPGTMYYLSIFSHLQAIAMHPINADANGLMSFLASTTGANSLKPNVSGPVLVILPIGAMALAALWFTHSEYLPRDDI